MAFLDLTGLSYFLVRLHNTFASKDTFNRSKDGLVPHPSTDTSTRFLREDGSWEIPTDKVTVNPTNKLTTSDLDAMFKGTYSSSGVKLVDDTVIKDLVDRIKSLESHAIIDSRD